jgi:hypothetical protein
MRESLVGSVALLVLTVAVAGCARSGPASDTPAGSNAIRVLSNRADLISGGDALIEIALGDNAPEDVEVALNGDDVTSAFSLDEAGRFIGLVSGMKKGDNTLTATIAGQKSRSTLVNHDIGGPIFAGPQLQPWTCKNESNDAQCNQAPVYTYYYKSSRPLKPALEPYDPQNPPDDVARTTTQNGVTMPYIVRVETGYQDRDQYQIAVLFDPAQSWSAAQPQKQFNHKLVVTHGHSCGVAYQTGTAPSVLNYAPANLLALAGIDVDLPDQVAPNTAITALGEGYALMSTALSHSLHNCNLALQAESLMMAKEHLIESYGTLRFTIGTGCSGGSLAAQQVANAYPGIYQGVVVACSFPDAWSTATQFADYHLLLRYFGDSSLWADRVRWPEGDRAKVMGHIAVLNAIVSDNAQWRVAVPTDACPGTTAETRYDALSNPGGMRCTITDAAINLLGPRPPELWGDAEQRVGHGFAGFPVDNVGVQYGLAALKAGSISPAQFVDLNLKIGGLDVDAKPSPARSAAVIQALANAYRTGAINEATYYDQTAIIDCRGPDPGLFHDAYRAFAVRARLDREHGSHANQLIWEGPFPVIGDTACNVTGLNAMNRWLEAVEGDISDTLLATKLVANKPADLGDQCWSGAGVKLADRLCSELVVPIYGTPRTVAGDAITTDTNKCQLKPIDRADYGAVKFTDEQWQDLQTLFKDGVCDFSQPGVAQQATIPWQTYAGDDGGVIYGGRRLPAAPEHSGGGWASPAFAPFS